MIRGYNKYSENYESRPMSVFYIIVKVTITSIFLIEASNSCIGARFEKWAEFVYLTNPVDIHEFELS
jgi:hypothetical protein